MSEFIETSYHHTQVARVDPHALREQRVALARALPHLTWRCHGIGMLQAYLTESEPEVRVHVWHPSLATGPSANRVHNHRFRLRATVLHGAVGHEEFDLAPDPAGPWQIYEVPHARLNMAEPATPTDPTRYTAATRGGTIDAGHVYWFDARRFHRSGVAGLAVTLVTKLYQGERPAAVLAPYGSPPSRAFVAGGRLDAGHHALIEAASAALLG